jgi:iron complex transport system ATP-binding protein
MVNTADILLEARGLEFGYAGGVPVLRGVDVELAAGRLVALLGPNGAGKSTLLRVLSGWLRPDRGTLRCAGAALLELPVRERARRVALVPQSLASLPRVSVADFVLGGRYVHRSGAFGASHADRAVVAQALSDCDLAAEGARLLDELSGGQRQRALLARALAQQAALLLVDEPTNALDPEHQLGVFDLLERLARSGRAVAVVTHDMNLASQYADEIALLCDGRIVERGAPREMLCAERLAPVYGERLAYGAFGEQRFVLPSRRARGGAI